MNQLPIVVAKNGIEEDLQSVADMFSLPKLHYIDLHVQTQLDQMLAHWPLLLELTLYEQKRGNQ